MSRWVLLALLCVGPASAQEATRAASDYARAHSVFVGVLEGLDSPPDGSGAVFRVSKPIKGLAKGEHRLQVRTPVNSECGTYSEENVYLVYARRIEGELWADPCEGTKHISLAEPDLRYIHTVNAKVWPTCSPKRLRELAGRAEVIAKAEVVSIAPVIMNCWSGIAICTARVAYDVRQVFKGRIGYKRILVEHLLLKNSLTGDIDNPRLSPTLFREGNVLLLFLGSANTSRYPNRAELVAKGVGYVNLDEDCGAVMADEATVALLKLDHTH
jgi:hypothetical protein